MKPLPLACWFAVLLLAAARASGAGEAQRSTPFGGKPRTIPGVIQAEDYDEGGQGVAYNDRDPEKNHGKGYRKDGVDIKGNLPSDKNRSSDGSPTVGWIFDKEWLAYTVDVKPGVYDVLVRVATPVDTKKMRISLDGQMLTTVTIPNTGGYNKWQTVTVKRVNVPKGRVLKWESTVESPEEFDLNWIEFVAAR